MGDTRPDTTFGRRYRPDSGDIAMAVEVVDGRIPASSKADGQVFA